MEMFGIIAFVLAVSLSSYPARTKRLQKKVKQLERRLKGETTMSKMISELVGCDCTLKTEEGLALVGSAEVKCKVLDCDDEWIKFCYIDKKKVQKVKLMRIDAIDSIELASEMV